MTGYKLFRSDFGSPIQTNAPIVWDGTYPFTLPTVEVDTSDDECGSGWNCTLSLADAISIAGLWTTGCPNIAVRVDAPEALLRGTKCRSADMTILEPVSEEMFRAALLGFSQVFAPHAEIMAAEQWAWYQALGRPRYDVEAVTAGLRIALDARGLTGWTLKRFDTAWAAWAARASSAASAAWEALTAYFASRQGWIDYPPDLLTVGIRDAYANGLDIAVPVGDMVLGWAMGAQIGGAP